MSAPIAARIALLCAAVLALAPRAGAAPLEVVDAAGRRVTVEAPALRIASLSPSVTEILFAIGAEGALAGVSKHCDFPVAAKLKPKLGDFNVPDVAKLSAAGVDLVLFTEYARAEDLKALEEARITALVLPAATTRDIVQGVTLLGRLAGRDEAAAALAARLESGLEEVRNRFASLPDAERPRVYAEVDGPAKLYAVGPGSFMDELIRLAGGRNALEGHREAYYPVEPREVIAADPQVILIDHPFQYKVGVAKREGWAGVDAVRNGRVYDGTDFDIVLFNRPGPRVLASLRQLIPLLHPSPSPGSAR